MRKSYLSWFGHEKTGIGQWGTIGDYFGGMLNPILAFLGLILLLKTIRIQSEELKNSTKELQKSAKALQAQEKQLIYQTFENTFFQLLSLYHENVQILNYKTKLGNKVFSSLYFESIGNKKHSKDKNNSFLEQDNFRVLSVYFRNLFNILKFVDNYNFGNEIKEQNSDKIKQKRKQYIHLIRAQLSSEELALIFYNAYYFAEKMERPKFKELIEKYALFEDFPENLLLHIEHKSFYSDSAYFESDS